MSWGSSFFPRSRKIGKRELAELVDQYQQFYESGRGRLLADAMFDEEGFVKRTRKRIDLLVRKIDGEIVIVLNPEMKSYRNATSADKKRHPAIRKRNIERGSGPEWNVVFQTNIDGKEVQWISTTEKELRERRRKRREKAKRMKMSIEKVLAQYRSNQRDGKFKRVSRTLKEGDGFVVTTEQGYRISIQKINGRLVISEHNEDDKQPAIHIYD